MSQPQKQTPKHPMTQEDAARIQSHSDRTGTNEKFKQAAQSAADKRAYQEAAKNQSGQQK